MAATKKRILHSTLVMLLCLLVTGMATWGVLALCYSDLAPAALRPILAPVFSLFALAVLTGLTLRRWRRRALGAFAIVFAALLAWWTTLEPSNERNWKPEVAVLPYVTFDGELATLHDIRNFDYRTESDFKPMYYDKVFDLRQLSSVDLIASYWAGPAIAHIFVSFGFGEGEHLAISIERRDESGESYSTLKGLFKQYELFYVVADERDVIRVRTNYRHDPPEDVYIYRLHGPIENGRRLFLEYLRKIESLKTRPEFYNTITTNCTSNIWLHSRVNPGHVPYSWKVLLSGHVPEYLYERGRLDTRIPFSELQRRGHVNAAARVADQAVDFSRQIRAGLPETE